MIGQTVSHYRILERLGGGGMGVVYKAHDLKLDRPVALKFLPSALTGDPESRARFIHEARAASSLQHANICVVHDIEETRGEPGDPTSDQVFICMEYLEGETLKKRIERGPLKIEEAIDIAGQIARGLTRAHEHGIVHRDIKPANVMLTVDGVAKIVDFGVAKLSGRTMLTAAGSTLGTAAYMPPEQARGEATDRRADIWSLGVVLYEMLIGRRPFEAEYENALLYSIQSADPPLITGLRSGIPLELERIVMKCLAKDPEDRYQHAEEILADLHALSRMTATTRSEPGAAHTLPPARRSKPRWPWVAGVALVALAGVVAALYLSGRPGAPAGKPLVVVLPFENLGSPDDQYFADGITEEITSRLSAIRALGVISRTSAIQYRGTQKSLRQIGKELNASHVLEGTVRWERPASGPSRVRVTPQLIRVADDVHLWSDRYDRDLTAIFDVQADIARQVTEQLNVALSGQEVSSVDAHPTQNLDAYNAYLRGLDAMARPGYEERDHLQAVSMFRRATELDPDFSLARAELANACLHLFHHNGRRPDHREQARVEIERALRDHPELPRARMVYGYYFYWGFFDFERALQEFDLAEKGLPNKDEVLAARAYIWRRQGRFEEARLNQVKALELNPRSGENALQLSMTCTALRRFDEAERYLRAAVSLYPDFPEAHIQRSWNTWLATGNGGAALGVLDSMPNQSHPDVRFFRGLFEYYRGNSAAALTIFSSNASQVYEDDQYYYPFSFMAGVVAHDAGQSTPATIWLDASQALLERELRAHPDDPRLHGTLGWLFALRGRADRALHHARRYIELLPLSRDHLMGDSPLLNFAQVLVALGRYDEAIDQLEHLLSIPSMFVSVPTLTSAPMWKPIRDLPRFQALLARYR